MLLTSPEMLEIVRRPRSLSTTVAASPRSSLNDGVVNSPMPYERWLTLERSVVPTTSRFFLVSSYDCSLNPNKPSNQFVDIVKFHALTNAALAARRRFVTGRLLIFTVEAHPDVNDDQLHAHGRYSHSARM